MKATFKMLFFAQRARIKSNGKAPILARITINGKTSTFSTQLDIEPDRWDSKAQRTLGKTKTEKETNAFLDQIFATSQHSFFALQSEGKDVTAERIKQKVWGTEEKAPHTLRELSDLFIKDYEELVNANRSGKETLFRYHVCQNRVLEFVSKEYGMKDIPLDDVDKRFLDKFYLWLRSEYNNANNTAVKLMQKLASIFKMGRDNGWVQRNPFAQVRMHLDPVDRSYLTKEELEIVYNKQFTSRRLEAVRDMFILTP